MTPNVKAMAAIAALAAAESLDQTIADMDGNYIIRGPTIDWHGPSPAPAIPAHFRHGWGTQQRRRAKRLARIRGGRR